MSTSVRATDFLEHAPEILETLLLSKTGKKGHHIVAKAIDFLPDGSKRIHYSYDRAELPGDPPSFQCPLPSDSIRVVLFETKYVFKELSADVDGSENNTSYHCAFQNCDTCMRSSENDPSSSSSSLSLISTGTSHISPKTKSYVSDNHRSSATEDRIGGSSHDSVRNHNGTKRDSSQSSIPNESTLSSSSSSTSTTSTVSSTDPSEPKRGWKKYRGASGYESLKMCQIWDRNAKGARLPIGINLMFDIDTASGNKNNNFWVRRIPAREKQSIVLKGLMTTFFTVPNYLRSIWREGQNALEVQMLVFTTFSPSLEGNARRPSSPLGDHITEILCSERSAMAFFKDDVELGARLFAFDMLTAIVVCWLAFLNLVYQKSVWGPRAFSGVESSDDQNLLRDFQASIRDLFHAVDITVEAIETAEHFEQTERTRFQDLKISRQRQREVLQNTIRDIQDSMESQLNQAKDEIQQRQAASVKRLSLVASIFLPLTTACSLLSMNNRVRDLGPIWWDWLGIVVILGFVVVVGYSITSSWQKIWYMPRVRRLVESLRRKWNHAKSDVLSMEIESRARRVLSGRTTVSVIPISSRLIFWATKYLFAVAAVASFLVGMFVSVSTGAEALGYSAAGALLGPVAAVLVWNLVVFPAWKIAKFILVKIIGFMLRFAIRLCGGISKLGRIEFVLLKFLFSCGCTPVGWALNAIDWTVWCLRWLLKWVFKGLQWVFALFFGDKTFPILFRLITNQFYQYDFVEIGKAVLKNARTEASSNTTSSSSTGIESESEASEDRQRSYSRRRHRRSYSPDDEEKGKHVPDQHRQDEVAGQEQDEDAQKQVERSKTSKDNGADIEVSESHASEENRSEK